MVAWLIVGCRVQPSEALDLEASLVPALRSEWRRAGYWNLQASCMVASFLSSIGGKGISVRKLLGPFAPAPAARMDVDTAMEATFAAMLRRSKEGEWPPGKSEPSGSTSSPTPVSS